MKYEMLSHTSEAKFRAYGSSNEERFSNAALAMTDIMFEIEKIQPKIKKKIIVKGRDLRSLLHNWLEELILLLDSEFFVLQRIDKIKIGQLKEVWTLEAQVFGQTADAVTPRRGAVVKAVTYSETELNDAFVQIVVDV